MFNNQMTTLPFSQSTLHLYTQSFPTAKFIKQDQVFLVKAGDMANDRESNCFDDRTVSTADTERCLLNFDSTNLQYLQLNGDRLTWTSDLESLKKFVEKDLQQQGGNSKQFKSDNNNLVINWYNKKQLTLSFQGRDGPLLKDKLAELVRKKPGRKATLWIWILPHRSSV